MVYLDNAATTFPKAEEVYKAMDKANREFCVNAGRGSYRLARKASEVISETKQLVRRLVHADISVGVVLSPSVTVAMNQIVNGIEWSNSAVIYVSPYEHNAVARTVHKLAMERKLMVKEIPINEDTLEIDLERLKYEFSKDKPEAVFCTHVSNVTGYVLPVKEIFEYAKKYGSLTILDSAQSLGLIDININQINADLIAFAGHKTLYGPLGIGGFINVTNVKLNEFITGGTGSDSLNLNMPDGIETKYEAASSNIVAIAGLNEALKSLNLDDNYETEKEMTEYLINALMRLREVKLYLPQEISNHIGIVSFTVNGYSSDEIGTILDEDFDIAVRTGYHCAPYIHKYLNDEGYSGTVRVGIGKFNTKSDIDNLVKALKDIIEN
jgi:cysteine desulfurase family protein